MYKYYPSIIIDKEDVTAICETEVSLENKKPSQEIYDKLENYFGKPIIQMHASKRNDGQLILIINDGFVQIHPITKKRIVTLVAPMEDLKIILKDIFDEHPDETPADLYDKYSFQCPVADQFLLYEWFKKEYINNK